jgi:hypothetical protein
MGSGVSEVNAAYMVGVGYRRASVCPSAGLSGVTAVLPLCGFLCLLWLCKRSSCPCDRPWRPMGL